jgi:hypothetical protein
MTDKKPSATTPKPNAPKQTARERYAEELAMNPRCKEAPKTGRGFIIGGVKRRDEPIAGPPLPAMLGKRRGTAQMLTPPSD